MYIEQFFLEPYFKLSKNITKICYYICSNFDGRRSVQRVVCADEDKEQGRNC